MKLALIVATLFLSLAIGARADVDTLECNTAAAIRVKYLATKAVPLDGFRTANMSGEFCLVRDGEAIPVEIDGQTYSMRYDSRPRNPNEAAAMAVLGFSAEMVFTPDDLPGRAFVFQHLVRKPYDPATDGNWRYTPLWVEYSDPILIVVGEDERQAGI